MNTNKDFTKWLAVLVPKLDINSLREQNKAKEWNDRAILVSIENGVFKHNADELHNALLKASDTLKANLEITNSLDDISMFKDNLKVITDWLVGTRKEITTPMDELKSSFTKNENLLKELLPLLKDKEDELNQKVYAIRKDNIIQYLNELVNSIDDIEVDMNVFNSFIELKMKNKSFDLNKSEKLGAAAIKQIEDEFNNYVNPLIEAKKLSELKDKEQQFLSNELSKIITSGTNEVLENSIKELNAIDLSIDKMYANIKESAKSQVLNINRIVHNSIENNKAFEKDRIQNDKDTKFLNSLDEIDMNSQTISYFELMLEGIEKYEDLANMIPSNKDIVNRKIGELYDRIQELKRIELSKVAPSETKEYIIVDNVPCGTIEKTYKLNDECISLIAGIDIKANSQDDAKKQIIEQISSYLDMIDLSEI